MTPNEAICARDEYALPAKLHQCTFPIFVDDAGAATSALADRMLSTQTHMAHQRFGSARALDPLRLSMRQFSRYLTVGVLNTAFGYAVIFALMYVLGVSPQASNAIGYCVGLMTSYLLNRTFTFRSSAPKLPEFVRFVAIFLLSFAANFACLTVLLHLGTHAGLSQLIAGVVYVATSYLLSRSFVFRPRQAADAR